MAGRTKIIDLLVRWEEAQASGSPAAPAELCRDCPDLLPELERRITQAKRFDALFDPDGTDGWIGSEPQPYPDIPDHEILDVLGSGGMGIVYEARHVELNKTRAVKMVRADRLVGPAQLRRFEREAKVLADLEHENIVPVYHASLHHGQPYFVMPRVRGGSLEDRIDGYKDHPRDAVELIRRVALAVDHAHKKGVVHRDLKPANILLDEAGKPLVSDFGIAMMLAPEATADAPDDTPADAAATRITRDGARVGTLPYMAPEQLAGDLSRIGPPTDVWALGVILYRLLTGERPFSAKHDLDLSRQIADAAPLPPARHPARVEGTLSNVVLRCLRANSFERYQSAARLAKALSAWLGDRPVGGETSSRRWRRRLRRTILPAGIVLAVMASLAVAGWSGVFDPSPPKPVDYEYLNHTVPTAMARMQQGQTYVAVGDGLARRYRVRVGDPWVTRDNDRLRIDATRPTFVEFLPRVPVRSFRVRAEVRHDSRHDGNGQVLGLAWAYTESKYDYGKFRLLLTNSYSDFPSVIPGVVNRYRDGHGKRRSLVEAFSVEDRPGRPPFFSSYDVSKPSGGPEPPRLAERPFRRLELIVRNGTVTALWNNVEFASLGPAWFQRSAWMVQLCRTELPGLDTPGLDFSPDGPVGIFVINSTVTVRRFTVEPLTAR